MNLQRLIGTDEAGYGPNLGPLVIGCSCWDVTTDQDSNLDLYRRLAPLVTANGKPTASNDSYGKHIQIADSKQVYRSGNLKRLERNVLAIIGSTSGEIPRTGFDLLRWIMPAPDWEALINTFWLAPFFPDNRKELGLRGSAGCGGYSQSAGGKIPTNTFSLDPPPFPIESNRLEVEKLATEFSKQCEVAGVQLSTIQCRVILPTGFNQMLSQWGNKAELLSHCTLDLIRGAWANGPPSAVDIHCDKHGGRSHYAGLIQHFLGDGLVIVENETRAVSRYRFRSGKYPATITFSARGESFLSIALSSMVAKYLREYLMELWNRYWQIHLPNIKPTQGYPVDARRFLLDIEETLKVMNVPLDTIWRRK